MIENDNVKEEALKESKNWWKWFLVTVVSLFVIYIIMITTASSKIEDMSIKDQQAITSNLIEKFQNKYPKFKELFSSLPKGSKELIKKSINDNIDKAYSNVYERIGNFSDFHYSVTGEYKEIFIALSGRIDDLLYEKIFTPSNFTQNLNSSLEDINNDTNEVLKAHYNEIKEQLRSQMNINDDQTEFLLQRILKFSQENMISRFQNNLGEAFKGFGFLGGATAGTMTKAISASVAKMITKKIATKAAIKGGSKLAGAGAGALAGGESGLLCGPGAWLCSTAGAVVGGVIGWFATDKIVVEIDQYMNEEEFKEELKKMITKQKEQTKHTMYKIYQTSLDNLSNENIKKIDDIKNHKVLELIK